MKKITTTYVLEENKSIFLTKDESQENHYSIHNWGEPCSGIMKHWASKEGLIQDLEAIIKALEKVS